MKRKVLLVSVLPLALVGCFGSRAEETPAAPSASLSTGPAPSSTSSPAEASDVYVDVDNSQGEGDYVGALTDVSDSSCASDGESWFGSGTLANPSDERADYRVWVAFIDSEGQTVGLVQANVDGVRPGDTGDFSTSMPYADSEALTCVLRVERRVAAD